MTYPEIILIFQASELVRKEYDFKCRLFRQLESKGESSKKVDKTRAVVKDLHSRIRVAIHRINSISKKIEELRDNELQPQLEELIEGYVMPVLYHESLIYQYTTETTEPWHRQLVQAQIDF